jgi:alkyl hydroperoxide reductase subunit AhpC
MFGRLGVALVFKYHSCKKVEEQYQGKNIEFVSISVDNIKDREKWSNLVNKKQLGGIQLLADKEFNSEFIKQYSICKSKVYSNRPKWQHCKFQCSQTIRNRTD